MINIEPEAAARLIELVDEGQAVYIGVRGGGCSGFEYQLHLGEDQPGSRQISGVPIVIAEDAESFLQEARLTWEDGGDFNHSGFKFANPAYSSCGCGKSFG